MILKLLGVLFTSLCSLNFNSLGHKEVKEEKPTQYQMLDKSNQRVILSMSYLLSYEGFKTIYAYCNNSNNFIYDNNNAQTPMYILTNSGTCDYFYTRTYDFSNDTYYMNNNQIPISILRFGFRQFANQDFYSGSVSYNFYRFYMWTTSDTSQLAFIRFNYYVAPFQTDLNHYSRNEGDLFYSSAEINNNGTFTFADYTFTSYSICSRFHNALYDAYLYYGNNNDNQQSIYDRGFENGREEGLSIGYADGYQTGYGVGIDTGNANGYDVGYNNGYQTGNAEGYQTGYGIGYSDAENLDSNALTIFTGILQVGLLPVNVFLGFFQYEVFGINIAGFVGGLLTIAITIIIIRIILGGNKND